MSRIKCLHEESSSSGSCEQANISSYVSFESWEKENETVLSTAHVGTLRESKTSRWKSVAKDSVKGVCED
jgi:hypothetical protein